MENMINDINSLFESQKRIISDIEEKIDYFMKDFLCSDNDCELIIFSEYEKDFMFKFDGVEYKTITICSDGFYVFLDVKNVVGEVKTIELRILPIDIQINIVNTINNIFIKKWVNLH